jgi:hypothetical protein
VPGDELSIVLRVHRAQRHSALIVEVQTLSVLFGQRRRAEAGLRSGKELLAQPCDVCCGKVGRILSFLPGAEHHVFLCLAVRSVCRHCILHGGNGPLGPSIRRHDAAGHGVIIGYGDERANIIHIHGARYQRMELRSERSYDATGVKRSISFTSASFSNGFARYASKSPTRSASWSALSEADMAINGTPRVSGS